MLVKLKCFSVFQAGMLQILCGKQHFFLRDRPGDMQFRVIERDSAVALRMIDIIALVGEQCRFTQNGTQSLMLPKAVYTRCEIHNPDEEGMLDGNPMLKDCKLIKDDVPLTPRTTPITE